MTEWIVVRSDVAKKLGVTQARSLLRKDFCWSCAYCTITELEAQGVSFEVDHYEPQISRTDLRNVYSNLMYACRTCNKLKSDFQPTAEQRAAGYRFFKADEDDPREHFRIHGRQLKGTSSVGTFTITLLNLNQKALIRIRQIRKDMFESDDVLLGGIKLLAGMSLDQLPSNGRHELMTRIPKLLAAVEANGGALNAAITKAAASSLLLDDLEERKTSNRGQYLESIDALTPWRARDRVKK